MRLRRAVLQSPARSFLRPRLPFYKIHPPLTHSKSTLLQLLIPLHFNSPRINTYKKPGRGSLLPAPKFYNSLLLSRRPIGRPLTPFPDALTATSQRTENTTTLIPGPFNVDAASSLSPLLATLTENTRGGVPSQSQASSTVRRTFQLSTVDCELPSATISSAAGAIHA